MRGIVMNALTKDLKKCVKIAEKEAAGGRFLPKLHLMPPVGWLNDPNGLCQFNGVYHAFFQYSPFDACGGVKMWGHYTSSDMIFWKYEGVSLYPDQPFDCHGVYSGSALIDDGKMYLYYTGNVKLEDESYDYVNSGREANTVLVVSEDGKTFGCKKELMRNSDYPEGLTCHVRDPKVWKEDGTYYMIQGARTKDDTGKAIIFESKDKIHWTYKNSITSAQPFGYMWECPDYMEVDGVHLLSVSVQGLEGGIWDERNVYQSGYFTVSGDIFGAYELSEYHLWDYGFDYYAPQSFQAEDGRIIQMGWMGMPDCDEYTNLTIEDGWQHCFTFPREIHAKDGRIVQKPIRELDQYKIFVQEGTDEFFYRDAGVFDLKIEHIQEQFNVKLSKELILAYENGQFCMRFSDQDKTSVSAGRGCRKVSVPQLDNVEILADVSCVEVFINDGAYVFSTRYYPQENMIEVSAPGADIQLYQIEACR